MASRPDDPPESIILGKFRGIRNTVSRERLGPDELQKALNVDIDDAGQLRRRHGYQLKLAGDFHSVRNVGERILGVKDGTLGTIGSDYTFTSLGTVVGSARLSYAHINRTSFFSSLDASGKITDNVVEPWGAPADSGTWISPVVTPTDTLGEVFGKYLKAPPMAEEIEAYSGRIYLAAGRYLWATELYLYDLIDKLRNFMQFEHPITLVMAVNDGLYVGTEGGMYFLRGTLQAGLRRDIVHEGAVIRGSGVRAQAKEVHPAARQGAVPEGIAVIFMTDKGICAGFDGGQVFDLTSGSVVFPEAAYAAPLYRSDAGATSYVAAVDSAGGPTANARIGDYVDAEIIRGGS